MNCECCNGTRIGPSNSNFAGQPCPLCNAYLPPRVEPAATELSESNVETLDTLRDIEAFFRKEAAYECENMGAGGSTIALGRWKRYYMALANVIQDLPELIASNRLSASPPSVERLTEDLAYDIKLLGYAAETLERVAQSKGYTGAGLAAYKYDARRLRSLASRLSAPGAVEGDV